jgi:hypothetical protein
VLERLQRKKMHCVKLDYNYWRRFMLERLIFDSVSRPCASYRD